MRILFVAPRFPQPAGQGFRVRAYHQIRTLSRSHKIILVSPGPDNGQLATEAPVASYCEAIETVPFHPWRPYLGLCRALFSDLPFQTLLYENPSLQQRVKTLITKETFDLVHIQLIRLAPIAGSVPPPIPKVLDLIDAFSLNFARRATRDRGLLAGLSHIESRRVAKYEKALISKFDQLIISSPSDRQAIGDFGNLHVVPNGVDLDSFPFSIDRPFRAVLIFTGNMSYFPNIDAISWFVKSVFPLVRRELADAELLVVGDHPAQAVRRLSRFPGVTVTGYVPNIHSLLAQANVAIAPMRSGSGMQLKVLESMSSGTPLVATSFALGGLEIVHGKHLLVAEDAEMFAYQVLRLLRDEQLRMRLSLNARSLIERCYSWDRAAGMLDEIYRCTCPKADETPHK